MQRRLWLTILILLAAGAVSLVGLWVASFPVKPDITLVWNRGPHDGLVVTPQVLTGLVMVTIIRADGPIGPKRCALWMRTPAVEMKPGVSRWKVFRAHLFRFELFDTNKTYNNPTQQWKSTTLAFPVWAPILLLALACAIAYRQYCRAGQREGLCPQCGYDLRGSPGGSCPECGADVRARSVSE